MLAYLRFAPVKVTSDSDATALTARRWTWYVAALLLFTAAALSKTVVVTLPAVLLVILWWKRGRITIRDITPLAPFFAVGLSFGLVTVWMEKHFVAPWEKSGLCRRSSAVLLAGRAVVLRHEACVALSAGVFLSALRSTSACGGSISFRWRRC